MRRADDGLVAGHYENSYNVALASISMSARLTRLGCCKSFHDKQDHFDAKARKKQSSAIIAADVRRFGHVIDKDGVLGTHSDWQQPPSLN